MSETHVAELSASIGGAQRQQQPPSDTGGNGIVARAPLVSIVVNNYNYGRYLRQAVDSALGQTYSRLEVVVVDDGSTDDSRALITAYGILVVAVLKENGGQASAFNEGFARTTGELVLFLDADDYLYPTAVERAVAAWRPGLAKVHYRLQTVDDFGEHGGLYPPATTPLARGDLVPMLLEHGSYTYPPTSANVFSRAVLEQILPMPTAAYRLCADAFLIQSTPFYGEVEAIDEPLAAYRIHGGNGWTQPMLRPGGENDAARFREVLLHDLQKCEVVAATARKLGYESPAVASLQNWEFLKVRLGSLRLEPQKHPVAGDSARGLAAAGIRAVWQHSRMSRKRRLVHSVWFGFVGVLPRPAAKLGIAWAFAPEVLPSTVAKALRFARTRFLR